VTIELSVKLTATATLGEVFFSCVREVWGSNNQSRLSFSSEEDLDIFCKIEEENFLTISIDGIESVQCAFNMAGTEESLGFDGGWWAYISPIQRGSASLQLMTIAAACLAEIAGSDVVDESGLLGEERFVSSAEIFKKLKLDSLSKTVRRTP
jgi:hypothetical protein